MQVLVSEEITGDVTSLELFNYTQRISTPYPSRCKTIHGWLVALLYYHGPCTAIEATSKLMTKGLAVTGHPQSTTEILDSLVVKGVVTSDRGVYSLTKLRHVTDSRHSKRIDFNSYAGFCVGNRSAYIVYMTIPSSDYVPISYFTDGILEDIGIDRRAVQRIVAKLVASGLVESIGKNRGRKIKCKANMADINKAILAKW